VLLELHPLEFPLLQLHPVHVQAWRQEHPGYLYECGTNRKVVLALMHILLPEAKSYLVLDRVRAIYSSSCDLSELFLP
jgi:hypothetical protein